ncbi:hypothetical protein LKI_09770 [Leuconostoc kimchii IMSNU 11154]|uniref:DUF3800 domain-containing protein n=1 Tax=Leuconostoc kimchii (strain IMSNU 11154 / KCTC 2386 / IH25) TaxID=762051 RepID=D5T4M2_LEUKI|nr:DUF3800 domain-containing protein [Leuconostoc kimchii]ADG41493.1 hypothetical protein LKI_09770 [Leuconostoc kimchii IMSNU 11154]
MSKKFVYIDESGNFGSDGRYFTIAAIEVSESNHKKLIRNMRRITGQVKRNFPSVATSLGEVKAANSDIVIREYVIRKIVNSYFVVRYITVDLTKIDSKLLENQNILYNYLVSYIVKPIIKHLGDGDRLEFYIDERNQAVKNGFNIDEYIKHLAWFEMKKYTLGIEVKSVKSHKFEGIQVADFIAHAIQCKFEYNYEPFLDKIRPIIGTRQHFPYKEFGK